MTSPVERGCLAASLRQDFLTTRIGKWRAHVLCGRQMCVLQQEFVAIAGSEALRNNEPDSEKRKYPGGAFDPLGFAKDSKVPPPLSTLPCAWGLTTLVACLDHVCAQRSGVNVSVQPLWVCLDAFECDVMNLDCCRCLRRTSSRRSRTDVWPCEIPHSAIRLRQTRC